MSGILKKPLREKFFSEYQSVLLEDSADPLIVNCQNEKPRRSKDDTWSQALGKQRESMLLLIHRVIVYLRS